MPQHDRAKHRQAEHADLTGSVKGNTPQSLRIQPEVMALATAIAREQGEGQVAAVLRQALACGILVVAASTSPDAQGKLATFDPADLAKSLRRKLAAAVDLLLEHGQLPQAITFPQGAISPSLLLPSMPRPGTERGTSPDAAAFALDSQMSDDLDGLGIGLGISARLD